MLYNSNVVEIRQKEVDIDVGGTATTLANDHVIVQIGSLPPIDFLYDMGLELDGIWTKRRFAWAGIGLFVGYFIYFLSKHFTLVPEKAGQGKWLVPLLSWLEHPEMTVAKLSGVLGMLSDAILYVLPIPWLCLLGATTVNFSLRNKGHQPLLKSLARVGG